MAKVSESRYSAINSTDDPLTAPNLGKSRLLLIFKVCLAGFGLVCWTLVVFLAGSRVRRSSDFDSHNAIQLDIVPTAFVYNMTYAGNTEETAEAWRTLFPHHGSFFSHPTLAPETSTLSVYHQLHCVDGIRQGYWFLYNAASEGRKISPNDLPKMSTLPHFRHCIDLLRQALMCHADTTVEVVDAKLKGVHGFGTERNCRDWAELTKIFNDWQKESYERKQQNKSV